MAQMALLHYAVLPLFMVFFCSAAVVTVAVLLVWLQSNGAGASSMRKWLCMSITMAVVLVSGEARTTSDPRPIYNDYCVVNDSAVPAHVQVCTVKKHCGAGTVSDQVLLPNSVTYQHFSPIKITAGHVRADALLSDGRFVRHACGIQYASGLPGFEGCETVILLSGGDASAMRCQIHTRRT